MRKKLRLIGVLLLLAVPIAWAAVQAAEDTAAKDAVFKMEEVSAFDIKEAGPYGVAMMGGPSAFCTPTPNPEVKAYPKFKSKRPMYGTAVLDGGRAAVLAGGRQGEPPAPVAMARYHFALDESQDEAPVPEKPKEPGAPGESTEKEASKSKSSETAKRIASTLRGIASSEAASQTKYDLLYFDANADGDLTNDPVVHVTKDPPKGLPTGPNVKVFDTLAVQVALGGDAGTAKVRILPVLQAYGPSAAYMRFMEATARKGKIRLGSQEYTAILSSSGAVVGRLDYQHTRLQLIPAGQEPGARLMSTGLEMLGAMRNVDGVLYELSATPSGDELRVAPYRGEYGIFEVAPANKEVKQSGVLGVLMGKERSVMFGAPAITYPYPEPKVAQHKLPVGDYSPMMLQARVGKVDVSLRQNYYSAQTPEGRAKPPAPSIQIRKDKPLVLDFAQRPKVVFIGPPADKSVRTGDTVLVRALLIEPTLDLIIGGLEDRSRKVGELRTMGPDGNPMTLPRFATLDPDIVITDSAGKEVAKGKMPFG